jgi:hypothetical protein
MIAVEAETAVEQIDLLSESPNKKQKLDKEAEEKPREVSLGVYKKECAAKSSSYLTNSETVVEIGGSEIELKFERFAVKQTLDEQDQDRGQCYKTFYGRMLCLFIISLSIFPWQASPA